MKKILLSIVILLLSLSLFACDFGGSSDGDGDGTTYVKISLPASGDGYSVMLEGSSNGNGSYAVDAPLTIAVTINAGYVLSSDFKILFDGKEITYSSSDDLSIVSYERRLTATITPTAEGTVTITGTINRTDLSVNIALSDDYYAYVVTDGTRASTPLSADETVSTDDTAVVKLGYDDDLIIEYEAKDENDFVRFGQNDILSNGEPLYNTEYTLLCDNDGVHNFGTEGKTAYRLRIKGVRQNLSVKELSIGTRTFGISLPYSFKQLVKVNFVDSENAPVFDQIWFQNGDICRFTAESEIYDVNDFTFATTAGNTITEEDGIYSFEATEDCDIIVSSTAFDADYHKVTFPDYLFLAINLTGDTWKNILQINDELYFKNGVEIPLTGSIDSTMVKVNSLTPKLMLGTAEFPLNIMPVNGNFSFSVTVNATADWSQPLSFTDIERHTAQVVVNRHVATSVSDEFSSTGYEVLDDGIVVDNSVGFAYTLRTKKEITVRPTDGFRIDDFATAYRGGSPLKTRNNPDGSLTVWVEITDAVESYADNYTVSIYGITEEINECAVKIYESFSNTYKTGYTVAYNQPITFVIPDAVPETEYLVTVKSAGDQPDYVARLVANENDEYTIPAVKSDLSVYFCTVENSCELTVAKDLSFANCDVYYTIHGLEEAALPADNTILLSTADLIDFRLVPLAGLDINVSTSDATYSLSNMTAFGNLLTYGLNENFFIKFYGENGVVYIKNLACEGNPTLSFNSIPSGENPSPSAIQLFVSPNETITITPNYLSGHNDYSWQAEGVQSYNNATINSGSDLKIELFSDCPYVFFDLDTSATLTYKNGLGKVEGVKTGTGFIFEDVMFDADMTISNVKYCTDELVALSFPRDYRVDILNTSPVFLTGNTYYFAKGKLVQFKLDHETLNLLLASVKCKNNIYNATSDGFYYIATDSLDANNAITITGAVPKQRTVTFSSTSGYTYEYFDDGLWKEAPATLTVDMDTRIAVKIKGANAGSAMLKTFEGNDTFVGQMNNYIDETTFEFYGHENTNNNGELAYFTFKAYYDCEVGRF